MKKLATSFVIILGLSFIGFQSFASEGNESPKSVSENPWEVFKGVVFTHKTSNVDFMYTSKADQLAFVEAADEMKAKISENSDFRAEEKIKRIDSAVIIFKYLWETNDEVQSGTDEAELIEIPEVI